MKDGVFWDFTLCGEDGRIVELNAVSLVDTEFGYGRLV
jgi:hypothetical protein